MGDKKKETIVYFVETKDKVVFIENKTFEKYFPNINVITIIFDDYVKCNVKKIMKKLEKKYHIRKYILSLFSSSVQDYFIPIIKKYEKSIFIALVSTAVELRKNPPNNLYFALESDDSFITKWINFSLLLSGKNILLSDCSDDVYIQGIIKLVQASGQTVICMNDMNTPENQKLLLNANVIGCSTLSFDNLLNMCSKIPKAYIGYVTIIDIGPSTNDQLKQLSNIVPPKIKSLSIAVPSTMMTLSLNNSWVNSVKLNKALFSDSYNICVYTILNSIKSWEKLLIKSNLIKNDLYYIYGLVYYVFEK